MRISDWSSDVCSSDLWQNVKTLEARASVGGAIWPLKGWEGHLEDASFTVDAQHQHVEYRSGAAPGQRSIYEPDRTSIVADDGQLVGERTSPRASFADHKVTRPWDSRSEEHTSELQSLMRISYAVFCLKKNNNKPNHKSIQHTHQH